MPKSKLFKYVWNACTFQALLLSRFCFVTTIVFASCSLNFVAESKPHFQNKELKAKNQGGIRWTVAVRVCANKLTIWMFEHGSLAMWAISSIVREECGNIWLIGQSIGGVARWRIHIQLIYVFTSRFNDNCYATLTALPQTDSIYFHQKLGQLASVSYSFLSKTEKKKYNRNNERLERLIYLMRRVSCS